MLHFESNVIFIKIFYSFYNAVRRCQVGLFRRNLHFCYIAVYRVVVTIYVCTRRNCKFFNLGNRPIAIAVQCTERNEYDIERSHIFRGRECIAINRQYVVIRIIGTSICRNGGNKLAKRRTRFTEPYVYRNTRRDALLFDISKLINERVAVCIDTACIRACESCKTGCVRAACLQFETVLRDTEYKAAAPTFRNARYVQAERTLRSFFAVKRNRDIIFVAVLT